MKGDDTVRLNTSHAVGRKLRQIQAEYALRFGPAKITLESLANLTMVHGFDNVRKKLNLAKD